MSAAVSVSAAKVALAFAATPVGQGLLTSGLVGWLDGLAPLVANYGVKGLAAILDVATKDTITDEECAAHLAAHGLKVPVYDPSGMAVNG